MIIANFSSPERPQMNFGSSGCVNENQRIDVASPSSFEAEFQKEGLRSFDYPFFLGKRQRPQGEQNVFVPGLDLDEKDDVVLGGDKVYLIPRRAIIARDYPEASFSQLPCGQILPQLSPSLRLCLRRVLRQRKFCGESASDQVFVML